jgi:hypothetical protein
MAIAACRPNNAVFIALEHDKIAGLPSDSARLGWAHDKTPLRSTTAR